MNSGRKLLKLALLTLLGAPFASAGIVRHVVKPVVKGSVKVGAKVVKTTAHVAKTVVY